MNHSSPPLHSLLQTSKAHQANALAETQSQNFAGSLKPRGRRPGIALNRHRALAAFASAGLTLAEMAAALGVTRQCVHKQLKKCPDLWTVQQLRRRVRRYIARQLRAQVRGLQWTANHTRGGPALALFLRQAMKHGWTVQVAPGRRPRVNGAPLAFHMPRRTRAAGRGHTHPGRTRYYYVQLPRPDWFNVIYLPSRRYVLYPPNPKRQRRFYYIRANGPAGNPLRRLPIAAASSLHSSSAIPSSAPSKV
jgi:hypothetical protein